MKNRLFNFPQRLLGELVPNLRDITKPVCEADFFHPDDKPRLDIHSACLPLTKIRKSSNMSKAQIASLSFQQIQGMEVGDLVRVILDAQLASLSGSLRVRLNSLDRVTLEEMTLQARKVCRQQGY
jgi:hypothetical protein